MNTEKKFSDYLLYICSVGNKMSSSLRRTIPPYWAQCLDAVHLSLISKIIQDYEKNDTPELERFPSLRRKVVEFYQIFEEELSHPFIDEIDGKSILNDSWIRISGLPPTKEEQLFSDDNVEHSVSSTTLSSSILYHSKTNRGLSFTIAKKGETEDYEDIDLEIPISEMYRTAIYLRDCGIVKPHFAFCVLFGVYGLLSTCGIPVHEQILIELENIYPYSNIENDTVESKIEEASETIRNLPISSLVEDTTDTIVNLVKNIDDESLGSILSKATDELTNLDKTKGSLFSIFDQFFPGSDKSSTDKIKETVSNLQNGGDINEISSLLKTIPKSSKKAKKLSKK